MTPHVIDTASGLKLNLDGPQPDQIALEDIAGGLARVCRFGAQALRFHSVAQHAVLVSRLVEEAGHPNLALAALHHDSHEAFACDVPSPLKHKMKDEGETVYAEVCASLDGAIALSLGIPKLSDEDEAALKWADHKALMMEAAELLHDGGRGIADATGLEVEPPRQIGCSLASANARERFLDAHQRLAG